ncbi:MAG: DUF6659 family protein [Nitrososphaeraceae archaeon]
MDYEAFCDEILRSDPEVRFAGIVDGNGEIRYGGGRPGITRLLTSEETKRSVLQAIDRWKLRNDLADRIGKGRYSIAEYEKLKRITVPIDETHLLLVSTEPSAAHGEIIENILRLKLLLR